MKKKILFQKTYDYYFNMKLSLEQNLLDIKSMESNQNIHNVLVESSKATQALKIDLDDFENVADKVRNNVENLKEVNFVIGDYNGDVLNNEDLEKELNDLQLAEDKASKDKERKKIIQSQAEEENKAANLEKASVSRIFPSVNKNNIVYTGDNLKENNNVVQEKENFINENSFQEILEELNKA